MGGPGGERRRLTATQRLALAVRMHVPPATACPSCGLVPDGPLPVRLVTLAEPPEVAEVLAGRPLAGVCANCATRFDVHAAFAFLDDEARLAIGAPAARLPAALRDALAETVGPESRVIVCDTTDDGVVAVGAQVRDAGAWLVDGFLAARAGGRARDWVASIGSDASLRAIVAAGLIVSGDLPGMAAMQELTALRAADVARAAIVDGDGAPRRLDALVPVWASRLGDRCLREAAASDDGEERLAAALALAWAADRGGPALDDDGARAWAAAALDRLSSATPPGDVAVFGDPGFLKRTVDPGMLLEALHGYEAVGGEALRRAHEAVARFDLLGGMPMTGFLSVRGDDDAHDAVARRVAEESTEESTASAIALLVKVGRLEAAEALYSSRLPGLLGTEHAADAGLALAAALNDADRPQAALDVVQPIMSDGSRERYPCAAEVQAEVMLVLAEARRLRLEYAAAVALIESVEAWLVDQPERRQRLCEVRFRKSKVLHRSGSVGAAREVLERLLDEQLPRTLRFDVLVDLGGVLSSSGDYEAASSVYRRAADVGAPIAAWLREPMLGLRMDQIQVEAALGHDAAVLSEAEQMLPLLRVDEPTERAQLRTLMAEAAARAGDESAAALHARQGLDELDRLEPPGHELARRSNEQVRARLLAAGGRSDELERLVAESPSRSWMLPSLLARTRGKRRAWSSAREAVGRSWTVLFDQLLADNLTDSSIWSLRMASELQRWTGEVVLQRSSGPDEDLLWAAELQSGLVSGLVAWPKDERRGAIEGLSAPGQLRTWLDDDVLTISPLAGLDELMLLAWTGGEPRPLGRWDRRELDQVRREVAAVTKRGDPHGDPLAASPAWNAFAARLGAEISGLLPAKHVLFAGTALEGIPLHMLPSDGRSLCRVTPCSYAPSLLGLAGLRKGAAAAISGRPRIGILSVVRVRELRAAAEAFELGAHSIAAAARRHGSEVETLRGPAASPARFGELLARSEIVCLSCHGLARPGSGSHALLLADGTTLPPQLVAVAAGARNDRFVLDWDRIPAPTPPAVVSAACSSGSGSTLEGGERVALDRSFLARGSRLFVGPLWDVGVTEGLELVAGLLDRRLGGRGWADGWVEVLSQAGDEMPPAAWSAFVIIGDWRT